MSKTHLVPKGTMPPCSIDMGRVAAEHRKMREPVRSIKIKKTPLWLRQFRAELGSGYTPTWGRK